MSCIISDICYRSNSLLLELGINPSFGKRSRPRMALIQKLLGLVKFTIEQLRLYEAPDGWEVTTLEITSGSSKTGLRRLKIS